MRDATNSLLPTITEKAPICIRLFAMIEPYGDPSTKSLAGQIYWFLHRSNLPAVRRCCNIGNGGVKPSLAGCPMSPEQSLTVVMVPTTPWTLEGALKSPEDWAEYRLAVQELAVEAQATYAETRRLWVADPQNELHPLPESEG